MPYSETRLPADWYTHGKLDTKEADRWYSDPSETVIPGLADAGRSTHQPPPRSAGFEGDIEKKRRRTKIISLSVCVVVLIILVAVAAWQVAKHVEIRIVSDTATQGSSNQIVIPGSSDSTDSTDVYEDYRDYFDNYYTGSDSVDIPQAATGTGVTLTLEALPEEEMSLQDIYDAVSPAVVGLMVYVDGEEYSWGTGVVFDPDGYIVTNTHILEGGDEVIVTFADGSEYEGMLVGSDSVSDISVLYLEGDGFPYATFGDSDEIRVGDAVVAIGDPLGEDYAGTMTNGIISAIDRNIVYNGHSMTLLQTNAALNEGNSGGPLINAYGQIVGITNMKIMSSYFTTVEGIGFAIPSSVVKEITDQLIEYGVVLGEPTIGIVAGPVSTEAMLIYGLPAGVYVSEVSDGSDAKEKGLQEGDIILEVNGIAVTTVAEVNEIKEGLQVGDALTLTVYRDGETFEMEVLLVDKSVIN